MNCVLTLPSTFSKNYRGNEPGVFAHFLPDIQLYSEARKSLPLHGKCGIQEQFFRVSKKTFKMGKAENGEQYCSATTQHHNTTIS